jgi:hypothetical protein
MILRNFSLDTDSAKELVKNPAAATQAIIEAAVQKAVYLNGEITIARKDGKLQDGEKECIVEACKLLMNESTLVLALYLQFNSLQKQWHKLTAKVKEDRAALGAANVEKFAALLQTDIENETLDFLSCKSLNLESHTHMQSEMFRFEVLSKGENDDFLLEYDQLQANHKERALAEVKIKNSWHLKQYSCDFSIWVQHWCHKIQSINYFLDKMKSKPQYRLLPKQYVFELRLRIFELLGWNRPKRLSYAELVCYQPQEYNPQPYSK